MSSGKRKKGISTTKKVIIIIELIVLIALLLYFGKSKIKDVVVKKTSEKIVESVIVNQAKQSGASEEEIQKVLDTVSEEDKEKVEEIVQNHMDSDVVTQGTEYLQNGDIEGLKQFASEELSPEETQELMELYEKYKDQY